MSPPDAPWHLLAGEFPPEPGGVSDYTRHLAEALASRGAEVHVWARRSDAPPADPPGVTTHRLADRWTRAEFREIGRALDRFEGPRRLLVQYTPNAFGRRGMNLDLGRWLIGRRRLGDDVRVMFHEVAYYFALRDRPTRWLLAAVHRLMVRDLLRACSQAYVSIPAWERMLRAIGLGIRRPVTWLPIPSTIPPVEDAPGVAAIRRRLAPEGQAIVGTFSTFPAVIRRGTTPVLRDLLRAREDRIALILGRGGRAYADAFLAEHPDLRDRVHAPGGLEPADVSRHVQACDLFVQYYVDGVSSRRTTTMTILAHGLPMATTTGHLTEPIWSDSGAVTLAPIHDPGSLRDSAESLLDDTEARARLGRLARELYEARFSYDRTVDRLVKSSPARRAAASEAPSR